MIMDKPYEYRSKPRFLPTVEVYSNVADKWHWRILSPDSHVIAKSTEIFGNKRDAVKNLRLLANIISGFCDRERKL